MSEKWVPAINDQRFLPYFCMGTIGQLPSWSSAALWTDTAQRLEHLAADGWKGVQSASPALCRDVGLQAVAGGGLRCPDERAGFADKVQAWRDEGYQFASLHVGTGFEDDAEMDRYAECLCAAAEKYDFLLALETHRATMTQDIWRTLRLIERFPQLRFNVDFSHWYTGHELRYGSGPIEPILEKIQPVFARCVYMHGRIGDGGCMQVTVDPERDAESVYLQHWRAIYRAIAMAFLQHAASGTALPYAPELLQTGNYYSRSVPQADGSRDEESDRYQQAFVITQVMREAFDEVNK